MESLFVRHSKHTKKLLPKVKFGVPGLDKILSGGLYLGSVTLLEEDTISKHYQSLLRCFLAEGASNKCQLFIYGDLSPDHLIPAIGKQPKQRTELRIAWRYSQLTPPDASSHIYDLSKSQNYPFSIKSAKGTDLYTQIYNDIANSMQNSNDQTQRRIYIKLHAEDWEAVELNTVLISIKTLVRSLNAVCLISVNMWNAEERTEFIIRKHSDLAFGVKGFEGETEFVGFCGTLEIIKNSKLQALANYEFSSNVFGIIRDSKFINVENLSLPPAESPEKPTLEY